MPEPFRPRLRADLLVERGPSVVLTDPVLRRRLDLGPIGDVLDRLDGRTAHELVRDDPRAEAVTRTLLLLSMLEEAGADTRARVAAHNAGESPLPVVTLPGARFACQGSGGCCRNFVLGPLTDADVSRVGGLALDRVGVPEDGWLDTRPRPDGRADRFLRTTDAGACVFLDTEDRCRLHATFGATSKPTFCQLFPVVAWPTPAGIRVYDGGECVAFPTSAAGGDRVEDAWRAAVGGRVPPVASALVYLAPGAPCDLAFVLPLFDTLVARVHPTSSPAETLADLAATLLAGLDALRRCPLAPDGPERALASVRPNALPADTTTQDEGRAALISACRALAEVFAEPLRRPKSPPPPFTEELVASLLRVAAAAEGRTSLPAEAPEHREMWALAFRQRLFGQRALVEGRPRAGLLRLVLDWLVARAHVEGERRGHTVVARRLDMPWAPVHRVLLAHEQALPAIVSMLDVLRTR